MSAPRAGRIAVTGSVAFDTIMGFPGRFADHILPGQTHLLNVSFAVAHMQRRRGGTAANIAYTLALLGENPLLAAAVGNDFSEYEAALVSAGVDTTAAYHCSDLPCASGFITTDRDNNQITAFYPGAMQHGGMVDLTKNRDVDVAVVSPDAPDAMELHIRQAEQIGARLCFAPAQQIPVLSDTAILQGLAVAWLLVGNDYEIKLLCSRTGRDVYTLLPAGIVARTHGAGGSDLISGGEMVHVGAAAIRRLADPTGAGDAYIAGVVAGLRHSATLAEAGRMGSVAAAYAVENQGTQDHHFSPQEFWRRYGENYGSPPDFVSPS